MSIYDITIWYQIVTHPEDALPLLLTSSIRCSQRGQLPFSPNQVT